MKCKQELRIKYRGLILFVFASVFVIAGYATNIENTALSTKYLMSYHISGEVEFKSFTESIQKVYEDNLSYHNELVDINSYADRISGVNYITKDDETVVLMNNGYLDYAEDVINDSEFDTAAELIGDLYDATVSNNADFLYVACPTKGYSVQYPATVDNNKKSNYDRYVSSLTTHNIPVLDLENDMLCEGITEETAFFITDHHWTPDMAFWANGKIINELNGRYNMGFDEYYSDLSNYDVTTYNDWFLGSQGKKVGRYFTARGVDDINLILPKFETSLTEAQPFAGETRTGSFDVSAMSMDKIVVKDYYGLSPYAAYRGGDYRLQTFVNNMNPEGANVLVIGDSFVGAIAPFMALSTGNLTIVDVRNYYYYVGEKPNVYEMIEDIHPDCVLVIYSGAITQHSDGRLDFD